MVHLNILLSKKWQNPEGVSLVTELLRTLGIEPVQSGRVAISCRLSLEGVKKVFGITPQKVSRKGLKKSDFGSPGGYVWEEELVIPKKLKEYVQSITISPPHTRL